ncbi:MAG: alpha-glucosidase C-terminal domain-containing protein [Terrimicrobiaceae bacterium]
MNDNHIRRLAALRREYSALGGEGDFRPLFARKNQYPFIYLRKLGAERILVAVNPSAKPVRVEVSIAARCKPVALMLCGMSLVNTESRWEAQMGGISCGVYKL